MKYGATEKKVTELCNSSIIKNNQLISDAQLYHRSFSEDLAYLDYHVVHQKGQSKWQLDNNPYDSTL
jgi:hypothetical protein